MYICPMYSMKAYRGSRGGTPLVFNLSTGLRLVVSFTLADRLPRG